MSVVRNDPGRARPAAQDRVSVLPHAGVLAATSTGPIMQIDGGSHSLVLLQAAS